MGQCFSVSRKPRTLAELRRDPRVREIWRETMDASGSVIATGSFLLRATIGMAAPACMRQRSQICA